MPNRPVYEFIDSDDALGPDWVGEVGLDTMAYESGLSDLLMGCGDTCPTGQSCRQTFGDAGQLVLRCLPEDDLLCRPCWAHGDCRPGDVVTNDLCVEAVKGAGFFCGRGCFKDMDCPPRYVCREAGTTEGLPAFQCVPESLECVCSDEAIIKELSTECAVTNAHGRCTGLRWCAASGLTPCDARIPERETCPDGVDEDCDGLTDEPGCEGCRVFFRDEDHDTWGVSGDTRCLAKPEPPYTAEDGQDCEDHDPDIHPDAHEQCNGLDDDCDGEADEWDSLGCRILFRDADGDGHGALGSLRCLCAPVGLYTADDEADCHDFDPDIHPGAEEWCDGVDNDCDGLTDPAGAWGCTIFYVDKDMDGHGAVGQAKCLCGPVAPYLASVADDCDDNDPLTFKGAVEVCDSGKDENCNGQKDEIGCIPCVNRYYDMDKDGYGRSDDFKCLSKPAGIHTAPRGGDCDDLDNARNPGAAEKCGNGKDDDCDGQTDEAGAVSCKWYYLDADDDGVGVFGHMACLCAPEPPWTGELGGDCNDSDPAVGPFEPERCNLVDDDCDGLTDTGGPMADCKWFYRDMDGDGFGSGAGQCLCGPSGVFTVAEAGDCDDSDATTYPGVKEVCDGKDNNCDGVADEAGADGCTTYWQDLDGDGFGGTGAPACLCAPKGKYTATKAGDCDDQSPWTSPGNAERCNNKDDDCDGQTDEGACPDG